MEEYFKGVYSVCAGAAVVLLLILQFGSEATWSWFWGVTIIGIVALIIGAVIGAIKESKS